MNYEKTFPIKRIVKELFPFVLNKDFMSNEEDEQIIEKFETRVARVLRDKWTSFRRRETFLTHTHCLFVKT